MITCLGLEKLGFVLEKDFVLEDLEGSLFIKEWLSESTQPSEEELNTASISAQSEYDAQAYARNRKEEYDALNQFELISDDAAGSTTTHVDAIAAIKTKWPKNNKGPIE